MSETETQTNTTDTDDGNGAQTQDDDRNQPNPCRRLFAIRETKKRHGDVDLHRMWALTSEKEKFRELEACQR